MTHIIGVRFQQGGKEFIYDAGENAPKAGDYVIVETSKGIDLAEVIRNAREQETEEEAEPQAFPQVVRIATAQDVQRATDNRAREQEAYRICCQKIVEHRLEMKLVSVEVLFDNSKMLFYFTANGRVDFRGLVKDLASVFKTRIELRQIGVRDEARMLGGLGPCGRPICCGSFLNDFQPVSIKMAKEQNLSLNPTKISGVCGRLMCCLKYEQDQYEQTRKRMPRVGREVITPDGTGVVSDLNIVKETVSVRIPNGDTTEVKEYPLEQISRPGAERMAQDAPEDSVRPDEIPEEEAQVESIALAAEEEIVILEESDPGLEGMEKKPMEQKPRQPRNKGSMRFGPRNENQAGEGEDPRTDREGRPSRPRKNERSVERSEGKQNEKASAREGANNKPRREQKFGQPVRRENPNRQNAAQGAASEGGNQETASAAAPDGAVSQQPGTKADTPAAPKKRSSWADAVERALKATDAEE